MSSPAVRRAEWGWDGSSVVALGAELVMLVVLVMLWVFASQSIAELLLTVRCQCRATSVWF